MKQKIYLFLGFALLGAVVISWSQPAGTYAALQATDFPTPTPDSKGRIQYTVQQNDTLWRIAGVAGITVEELRRLNNLGVNEVIVPGQVLLLGLGGPSEATPVPGSTQQSSPPPVVFGSPTPTAIQDAAAICVMLYADMNGDTRRQDTELGIAGGEVSVTERLGTYSSKQTTLTGDPEIEGEGLVCFENIPIGDYSVTMAVPEGYNPTTVLSVALEVFPGNTAQLNFGAHLGSQPVIGPKPKDPSAIFGVLGITVLLGGIGLFVYAAFFGESKWED